MSAPTTVGTEPEGRGLQPLGFGRPSLALLARADRGYARFLAHTTESQDHSTGGHGDMARHR